jgi:hypothetical protein
MQTWRQTHPLVGLAKQKDITRSYAGVYKRRGKIVVQPCRVCGGLAQMHHPDYDRPLEVDFLCFEHHHELHMAGALQHAT